MKQKTLAFVLAVMMTLALIPAARAAETFADVPSAHWAYDDIMDCAEAGIVTGMGDGKFHPGDAVTGIQFIVMMTRTFYNDQVEAARETETSSWYAPNMKVANDVGMLEFGGCYTLTVNDRAMNRYDMAFVLASTLNANGKLAGIAQRNAAKANIKDASSIPSDRAVQVYTAYHYCVIGGMIDGTFGGTQSMTRAQACSVIMRMMKLIDSEAPDQPVQPTQPGQSQPAAGKLTNGEDATPENVQAMLKEIEEKYPTGTVWSGDNTPNNNWYIAPATSKTRDVIANNEKLRGPHMGYACGGWACMVSETIFGQNGAPCREVYSVKDARPGDILYYIYTSNNTVKHVAIITSVTQNPDDGTWRFSTCDGNVISDGVGYVSWNWDSEYGAGAHGMTNGPGDLKYRIFTRYPE